MNTALMWSEFVGKLRVPIRGEETLAEYLRYSKAQQDEKKDVGGFVGGVLQGGRRKANQVVSRDLITLDLDSIPAGETEKILKIVASLGCASVIYSTRKHEPYKPRLRVIVPTNRPMTADEYEPAARMLASLIGIEYADPTTFEVSRLMYWPSTSADSQYVCTAVDAAFLDVDALLARYADWRNVSAWPQVPGVAPVTQHQLTKQGDPEEKPGIVGAFCRTYDIYRAMSELIPGQYVPAAEGRYTFTGGSTTGGAVIYEDGKFLYSHHATDPAGGKLCNSFDLVRLHLFAEKDEGAKADTPSNKLPSWQAMMEYSNTLPEVTTRLSSERYEQATEAFSNIIPFPGTQTAADLTNGSAAVKMDDTSWLRMLQMSNGSPAKTSYNVSIALQNDPLLKGRILRNDFADSIDGIAPLPWGDRVNQKGYFTWTDEDDAGLRVYIELVLGFRGKDMVKDAFIDHVQRFYYDPVKDYLLGLKWDNVPRLDTMFIDFFGLLDEPYSRAIARKILVGGVARAMNPGIKFDYMPVILGPQGIGKTTFCARLGRAWFSNGIKDFRDKTAAELLQGTWIVEFGELDGFSKADIRRIKGFLTQTFDHYRAAYAAKTEKHPRRCVFFGTTNDYAYLSDHTGNRRFWPVDAEPSRRTKNVLTDLTTEYVDQLWAEAVARWRVGEDLFLSPELEEVAEKKRGPHKEEDPLSGQIEEFLNTPLPAGWDSWDINKRLSFWSGFAEGIDKYEPREKVCAAEIWREMLNDRRPLPKVEAIRINRCLENIEGWERISNMARFGRIYGKQRGFQRKKIR